MFIQLDTSKVEQECSRFIKKNAYFNSLWKKAQGFGKSINITISCVFLQQVNTVSCCSISTLYTLNTETSLQQLLVLWHAILLFRERRELSLNDPNSTCK